MEDSEAEEEASRVEVQVATGRYSQEDLNRINKAIIAAESKTTGEIVPVIVGQSDFYPAAHFRLSLLGAFLAIFINYQLNHDGDNLNYLFLFILGSLIGFFCGHIAILKKLFSLKDELEEETRQRAIESFLLNGITDTKERNGVQLFISILEHKAMINVDKGLQERLGQHAQEKWQSVLNKLLGQFKKGNEVEGICQAISDMGEVLAEHYPSPHKNAELSDELPNKLIIDL